METSTIIQRMIAGNTIIVPDYQRAYSWETPRENSERKTHTDVFLSDLNEYYESNSKSPYYFGHFLFEEKSNKFYIIDGQQRLTTIVIFLSALFSKLDKLRHRSEKENEYFEDMVKRNSTIRFTTVDYDNQIFIDYVINRSKKDRIGLETESAKRIVDAFDYFSKQLENKNEKYLTDMLETIRMASCTTHIVKNEAESIQMFIFQNNRGKDPSDLEIIKAQFMYSIHLKGGEEKESLISEIKNRFAKIYKCISAIDSQIDEDDVLIYTLRVYYNSLIEVGAQKRINKELSSENPLIFIKEFSQALSISFENLNKFFSKQNRDSHYVIHSLCALGGIANALPFIIKAYSFGVDQNTIEKLCASLEILILRDRLIGTRADIATRINEVFQNFTKDDVSIESIIERVNVMKFTTDPWLAYWSNTELERTLQGGLYPPTAKYLLWKYENYLKNSMEPGYGFMRYDEIKELELEHIAPITEPAKKPHGYDTYDEEFRTRYINCLGNYLLASKSHNSSMHNDPFSFKRPRYSMLEQQREVQKLVPENGTWNKDAIQKRKEKIVQFVMANF